MKSESESCSVVSNSLWPHGLYSPWNSPDQNTGVGSLSLLQGIFPTQGSNPGLLHCRQNLYQLSHKGRPWIDKDDTNFRIGGGKWKEWGKTNKSTQDGNKGVLKRKHRKSETNKRIDTNLYLLVTMILYFLLDC